MFERVKICSTEAFDTPSKVIFAENGIFVRKTLIPEDYNVSKIVYFVSGSNGDEFGQFDNSKDAIEKALKLSMLTISERREYDI